MAGSVRVLYGGSANAKNVGEIVAQEDVDGALVGGASLDGEQFAQMSAIADIWANCSPSSEAPPTNAPSTSSCATISPTFLALAEPPYRTRTDPATSAFAICANSARIAAHTSCASAALATRPVPMAHTGS
ncbi:triosephosphate isomerase [Mycobacteroides abscessus subsp. abscessus]|nr:triosephosphate isomerase [Mycobacteroides abscessus subsp. abscessus]